MQLATHLASSLCLLQLLSLPASFAYPAVYFLPDYSSEDEASIYSPEIGKRATPLDRAAMGTIGLVGKRSFDRAGMGTMGLPGKRAFDRAGMSSMGLVGKRAGFDRAGMRIGLLGKRSFDRAGMTGFGLVGKRGGFDRAGMATMGIMGKRAFDRAGMANMGVFGKRSFDRAGMPSMALVGKRSNADDTNSGQDGEYELVRSAYLRPVGYITV